MDGNGNLATAGALELEFAVLPHNPRHTSWAFHPPSSFDLIMLLQQALYKQNSLTANMPSYATSFIVFLYISSVVLSIEPKRTCLYCIFPR